MMGQHTRSESMFYYFRLEDQVPEGHLLRMIDLHIDFSFVREQLKDSYSDTGRPSIDPELLLRIVLIGYLYGISSERYESATDGLENTGIYGIIGTYQEQRQVEGQLTLDQHIGVRIPGGQPIESVAYD